MIQESIVTYSKEKPSYSIRDFEVHPTNRYAAKEFIKKYHYSKGCGNAIMPWGLYEGKAGELIGVIGFHTPISENVRASIFGEKYVDRVTELHRMAIHPKCPKNTATWFISRALKKLKEYKQNIWAVISFADATEGHDGTVYQAANADYYGTTRKSTYYRDESGRLRPPRQCGENITPEKAEAKGWESVERAEKHRYVFWTPDTYMSKDDLRERCLIELETYP